MNCSPVIGFASWRSGYTLAVDGKDLDGVAVLFVEDVTNGRYETGREGVKTFYDHVLRKFHCSMHLVANHVNIDFDDDDHAHGVVYCRAHHHVLEPEHWFEPGLGLLGHVRTRR